MPNSMTAFARHESSGAWGSLVWELRSVNHRFLEPGFRLPEALRRIEPALRDLLKDALSRGKVDCSLQLQLEACATELRIDDSLLARLRLALDDISERFHAEAPVSALDLLRWPGVLAEQGPDVEALGQWACQGFTEALRGLCAHRAREGAELARLIHERVDRIAALAGQLRSELPSLRAAQKQRLLDRLADLGVDAEPQRLEQELVMMAQRSDVAEELDRLLTHLVEIRRALATDEPCGRRLDFLLQELNREANTLGSKSGANQTTDTAVEIKVLIEQIREQVQNLE